MLSKRLLDQIDIGRIVLTVGVHDDNGLTRHAFMDECEAYRQRALVSDVSA